MAIELKLTKSDCNTSWGFRLTGGAEFDVPITVIKVTENGLAEREGLLVGDVVVRVNDTPTAGLTHNETHDLLVESGNHLILAVRRNDIASPSPQLSNDHETNEEVFNILQESIQKEGKKVHFGTISPTCEESLDPEVLQAPSPILMEEHAEIVFCQPSKKMVESQEKKWSTFLQKPKNSKPAIKKIDDIPQSAPYRVIIKKQKKKSKKEIEKEVESVQETVEEVIEEHQPIEVPEEVMEIEIKATMTETEEITVDEDIKSDLDEMESQINKTEEVQYVETKKIDPSQKSLEEKLAEVQRQLAALSQLPSTIQLTLDAVTKELANIVGAKQTMTIEEEEEEEAADLQPSEADTITENDLTDHAIDENCSSSNDEERIEEEVEENEEAREKSDEEQDEFQPEDLEFEEEAQEPDPFEGLTEEEKEAKRLETQREEKYQKELEKVEEFKQRRLQQRPTLPLKPIERPIILPGGRKWVQPDDACPAVRHPKMSDEKIANTIEMFSESIIGKAKGINFLKYEPPAKNLEYLQRSEVYKLVHDTEPPVRGISTRASKILSEQDYYEQTKP